MILGLGMSININPNALTLDLFDLLNTDQINAVWVIYITIGIRHCNHFCSKRSGFLTGINSHVT